MQMFCQLMILVFIGLVYFSAVYIDFHGTGGGPPLGFYGFIISCILLAAMTAVAYGAGSFSLLF